MSVAPIDIVIPVYNAPATLARCLTALDRCTQPGEASVWVIDDASPDADIQPLLQRWAERSPLRPQLLANAQNLGFVGTVNRAFALTRADVLLLNADTEVTPGWLPRMRAALHSSPDIATVTPFSNNAEICSWPVFCQASAAPAATDEIAEAFAQAGAPTYPELPTAIGFCMLIRRQALDRLGNFDQSTFGRGYGEENDFCVRAKAHGWRNILCDDAYVVHIGGASFSTLGLKPGGENLQRLLARYPDYSRSVARFIEADPLAEIRARVTRTLESLRNASKT